jgi:hypothetical protein
VESASSYGLDEGAAEGELAGLAVDFALACALLVIALRSQSFPKQGLNASYLFLLGFPAGAAVAAKAITSGKVLQGTVDKTTATKPTTTPAEALNEIFSLRAHRPDGRGRDRNSHQNRGLLPADQEAAPGHAGSDGGHEYQISGGDSVLVGRFGKRERY